MLNKLYFIAILIIAFSSITFGQVNYYSKSTATNFNDINSWGTNSDGSGTSPTAISNADNFTVANNAMLTLNANASVRQLTVNNGNFTISDNTLTISRATGNNTSFIINGGFFTLSNTGNVILNGNFAIFTGGFTQSGGTIKIDANNANLSATSVAQSTAIFSITGGAINCNAGNIVIVDPPVNTYSIGSSKAINISLTTNKLNAFTGTHTFELGDGISTTSGNTDGFAIECGSSGTPLQNVTANGGSTTGRWAGTSNSNSGGTYIKGILTINAGSEFAVFRSLSVANSYMMNSIVNNGIFTTTSLSTIYLGAHPNILSYTPSTASNISGNGIFRNSATTTSTAHFSNLTFYNINGINFSAGALNLGTNTGHVSNNLAFISGNVNTNGQEFILGVSASSLGTLGQVSNGFTAGTKFTRWFGTTSVGTVITANTEPSIGGGSFPFYTSSLGSRIFHFYRTQTAAAIGGTFSVLYNGTSGISNSSNLTDGTYVVDKISNESWTISTGNAYSASTNTFTYAITAPNIITINTTNARIVKNSSTFVGNHQIGTTSPVIQRTLISATDFVGTFNLGINNNDLSNYTVQNGDWSNAATWINGIPDCSSPVSILHDITINTGTNANTKNLTIKKLGKLTMNGGMLLVGCSDNNSEFMNEATLLVNTGTVEINGNLNHSSPSTLIQNGGLIKIDGNSGNSATSVATGIPLLQFNSTVVTLTGGTILFVDPHIGTAAESALTYLNSNISYNPSAAHTFQFGDGVSTTTGGTTGFRIVPSSYFNLGSVLVNTLSNTPVTHNANLGILGNLILQNGEMQVLSGNGTVHIKGNIENNGILTTTGTLALAEYTNVSISTSSLQQSISGTGIFRNSLSSLTSTANFANLIIRNSNANPITMSANALLCTAVPSNTGTVSNTLTFTQGQISTGSNMFILGNSTNSLGILTHSTGGMVSGSTFARWFPAGSSGGTAITAASIPSISSSGAYPFINGSNSRAFWVQQNASPTTRGIIAVTYNNNSGGLEDVSINDNSYLVNKRSKESWTVQNLGIVGNNIYSIAVSAPNLFAANSANNRITYNNAPSLGTHQVGTSQPHAQRTFIALNDLPNTYYMGVDDNDILFQTVKSGNWKSDSVWNKNKIPSCLNGVVIQSGHTILSDSIGNVSKQLTINAGGVLNITAGTNTIGCTLNNNLLTNNGTLSVSGGTLNVNGNFLCNTTSIFNQSGGDINIDGNSGTSTTSAVTTIAQCQLNTSTINLTGGTLTIADSPVNTSSLASIVFNSSSGNVNATGTHTLRFGNGVSTDAGGNTSMGFGITPKAGTNTISFNNIEINTPSTGNRFVTIASNMGINGNLTITNNAEFRDKAFNVYIAGNISNEGRYIATGSLALATFLNGTVGVNNKPQTISGTGIFSNNATIASRTADFLNLTTNNTSPITFNRSISVSSTLTMTSGVVTVNSPYKIFLGTSTASGTLAGIPSATNMIVGEFERYFIASRNALNVYSINNLYPLGFGNTYAPIWLDPKTSASGPCILSAKLSNVPQGTAPSGYNISNLKWEFNKTATNFLGTGFRIEYPGLASSSTIFQAPTVSGIYAAIPGTTITQATTTLTSPLVLVASLTGILAVGEKTPCPIPLDQPTNFTPLIITNQSISAKFQAASSNPTGYLVVRYPAHNTPTPPTDLTTYTVNSTLGTGLVVSNSSATSFTTNLSITPSTLYDFYIYSYNNDISCLGPKYRTTGALLDSVKTCSSAINYPIVKTPVISFNKLIANWNHSTTVGVTGYLVEISIDPTFTSTLSGYPLNIGYVDNYTFNNLNTSTTYYYRIVAKIGNCASSFTINTITTSCPPTNSLPWNEGFEGLTTPNVAVFPNCWVRESGDWIAANAASNSYNNPKTGNYYITNPYTSNSNREWIWTPLFSFIAGRSYELKFAYAGDGTSGWHGSVAANTAQSSVNAIDLNYFVATFPATSTTYTTVSKPFTAPTTNAYSFGIGAASYSLGGVLGFDDFTIDTYCPYKSPTLGNINTTNIQFSVPDPSGVSPDSLIWQIKDGNGVIVDNGKTNLTTVTTALGTLIPNTTYYLYIKTDCPYINKQSAGQTFTSFKTPCSKVSTFPSTENFNTFIPSCWNRYGEGGDPTTGFVGLNENTGSWQSGVFANSGATANAAKMNISGSFKSSWLVTPVYDMSSGNYLLKYKVAQTTASGTSSVTLGADDQVQVLMSINNGLTWINIKTYDSTHSASNIGQSEEIPLLMPNSNQVLFAVWGSSGSVNNSVSIDFFVDDFIIETLPDCSQPRNIALANLKGTEATFTWSPSPYNSNSVAYNWEIRSSGAAGNGTNGLITSGIANGNTITVANNILPQLSNLNFYIKTNCGNNMLSSWSSPLNFNTNCAYINSFPWQENFNTFLPTCWSNYDGGTPATGPTNTSAPGAWVSDNFAFVATNTAAKFQFYNTNKKSWLITAPLDLSTGGYVLRYKIALTNGYKIPLKLSAGDKMQVLISTNGGTSWSTLRTYDEQSYISENGQEEEIDIRAYSNNDVKIAFWAEDAYSSYNNNISLFLDDIKILTPVNCVNPPAPSVITGYLINCGTSDVEFFATNLDKSLFGYNYQLQSSIDNGVSWSNQQNSFSYKNENKILLTNQPSNAKYQLVGYCEFNNAAISVSNSLSFSNFTIQGGIIFTPYDTLVCVNYPYGNNTSLGVKNNTRNAQYQWQSSTNNINYTNIPQAIYDNHSLNTTVPTYYRLKVTCGNVITYSQPVFIGIKPILDCYCEPGSDGNACITNVSIATINNNSTPNCVLPYFTLNTSNAELVLGETYTLSVTTTQTAIISVWIDYNRDGVFSASEWKQVTTQSQTNLPATVAITIPYTATTGSTRLRVRSSVSGNTNGANDACEPFFSGECEDYIITIKAIPKINSKVYLNDLNLGGATPLLSDYLKTVPSFPLKDPYALPPLNTHFVHVNNPAIDSIAPSLLAINGNNAIVDWVFLELRAGTNNSTSVQYTKSALLQADGDIVDKDGISPIKFPNTPLGAYYIAIRHRNHISFRTLNPIQLTSNTINLNFTNGSIALYGSSPLLRLTTTPIIDVMLSGDANHDGSIDAFDSILWEQQNGLFDDYINNADYNLDGSVDAFDSILWELNNGKFEELD